MHTSVTTNVINVTAGTYARAAMSRLAGRYWWVLVLPLFLFLIGSFFDVAYLYAMVIWIFMLVPPAMMIAYYNYLLHPIAAFMSRPHRVTIAPEGNVTVSFEPNENFKQPMPDIHIPGSQLSRVAEKSNYLELHYHRCRPAIIIIPFDSLPADQASGAIANLYH